MTTFNRIQIAQFELANDAYRNASITFYVVDPVTLVQSTTLATLYDAISGSATLSNPQTLDSAGKFSQPVYVGQACVGVISDSDVENHSTGVIVPPPAAWGGDWESGTVYFPGTVVRDGANGADTKNFYISNALHESGTWATDLAASKWTLQIADTEASALSAAASAAAASVSATAADSSADDSAFAADAAQDAQQMAQYWAANPENDTVPGGGGLYSALHYSAKAQAAAATFTTASSAEINTGSDTIKYLTADALNNSTYGLVPLEFAYPSGARPEVGDGAARLVVPVEMNGMDIVSIRGDYTGTVPSGAVTTIQIHNETSGMDILSTRLTIDSGERSSATAAVAAVINAAEDDLTTGDVIRLDIDTIGTTEAGTGLVVKALCRKP